MDAKRRPDPTNRMNTRNSHGKPRTELPRLRDVTARGSVRDPSEGRDCLGRFRAGNRASVGQGWKAAIRRALGAGVDDPEANAVIRQAMALYRATLRELPSDGPA